MRILCKVLPKFRTTVLVRDYGFLFHPPDCF